MFINRASTEVTGQVYLCFGCGNEFNDAESQRKHEVTCLSMKHFPTTIRHNHDLNYGEGEGQRKTVCEICRAYFSDGEFLHDHKLLHLNSNHICYLCDTYHVSYKLLAHHVTSDHRNRWGTKQNEEGVNEPYMCSVCVLRFSTLKSLQSHETIHIGEKKTIVCRICKASLNNDPVSVSDHLISSNHAAAKRTLMNVFTCIHCNTNFATRDSYAMHMMIRAKDENCANKHRSLPTVRSVVWTESPRMPIKQEPPDDAEYHSDGNMACLPSQPPRHTMLNESGETTDTARTELRDDKDGRIMTSLERKLLVQWCKRACYSPSSCDVASLAMRACEKCDTMFADRDELAMHMMSEHADPSSPSDSLALDHHTTYGTSYTTVVPARKQPENYVHGVVGNTAVAPSLLNKNANSNVGSLRENFGESCRRDRKRCRSCSTVATLDNLWNKRPKSAPSVVGTINGHERSVDRSHEWLWVGSGSDKLARLSSVSTPDTELNHSISSKIGFRVSVASKNMKNSGAHKIDEKAQKSTGGETHFPIEEKKHSHDTDDADEAENVEEKRSAVANKDELSVHLTEQRRPTNVTLCDSQTGHILAEIEKNRENLWMCKYCPVVFLDRTLFCLHMGMHNVNAPYQCNMCGHRCDSMHQFSAHALHF